MRYTCGTLKKRFVKCGKPTCACARDAGRRHGPYWYLVYYAGGRQRMRYVPEKAVAELALEIAIRRFWQRTIREIGTHLRRIIAQCPHW